MPNPIIEKVNVGGQDFDIAGTGQGNSIVHYATEAAMDADWSNIDNETDIVTEEEDDYELTASMIAYGQNSNVETEITQIKEDVADAESELTWEHTNTAILQTVTNPSGTYNINTEGYKAICVRGTFSNGGSGHNIISLDELKSMPSQTYHSNVFGAFGSQGTYGGVIGFILTPTSIRIDGKWAGSGVSTYNITVYGLK